MSPYSCSIFLLAINNSFMFLYLCGFTVEHELGFHYDWSVVCKVSEVRSAGPADQILKPGDRIIKVNTMGVGHRRWV